MSDAGTPDGKQTGTAESAADSTPARQLNANAKSFEPRLPTATTPKTPKTKNPNAQSQQRGAALNIAPPMPLNISPLGMPMPLPGLPPTFPGIPGMINPMLLSPMLLAMSGAAAMAAARTPSFVPGGGLAGLATPMTPVSPAVMNVNVGNASLQALRSGGLPKFACVLLVGMPRVGKTTIGRGLIQQLKSDGLEWAFFSGGDYIKDGNKAAPWDTSKDIFDALSQKIDDMQNNGGARGLIIDKQCRGTEELYYLTALLRSKGLHLNGVVGLVADDDQRLMDRLQETDSGFKEKCKFHRVIQTRIREACKTVGLWHAVDALENADSVVRKVRSMVLGCSSQVPHKHLAPNMYHDSQNVLVDSYETYASVMNTMVNLTRVQAGAKSTTFPGFTNFTPLSTAAMAKKAAFKEYAIRRRSDGTKYLLVYDGANMYLVPRHMRCVFNLRPEAWLGVPLKDIAKFVLDGDLVRLSKERNKEKFLVQDVLCWIDKPPVEKAGGTLANSVARTNWKERQERLTVNICGEDSSFFGNNSDIVIVHQTFVEFKNAEKLFEPCDYPTDGFVFQPTIKREDPAYVWRPPETVTVDFRLGPVLAASDSTKKYSVQVYDPRISKFVEYGTDTVTIPDSRQFVVEGALTICSLKPEEAAKTEGREWTYVRTRTDIPTCAYRQVVDDLLANCLIPKPVLTAFLGVDPTAPRPAPAAPAAGATAGTAPAAAGTPLTTAPSAGMQQPTATATGVPPPSFRDRTAFGVNLNGTEVHQSLNPTIAALGSVVNNVHVAPATIAGTPAVATQPAAGRKPRGPNAAPSGDANAPAAPVVRKQRCHGCNKVGEGDVDQGDHHFYCLSCWEQFEQQQQQPARGTAKPRRTEAPAPRASKKPDAAPAEEHSEGAAGDAHHKKTRRGGGRKTAPGAATPESATPAPAASS